MLARSGEIKICGLTSITDAIQALRAGADYLGFVLHPPSPRAITPVQLAVIAQELPPSAKLVGVFVDMPAGHIAEVAEKCRLHAVQLHGREKPEEFANFKYPVWKVAHVKAGTSLAEIPSGWSPERLLIDSSTSSKMGGTGIRAAISDLSHIPKKYRVILAGGLTPENVGEAITTLKPAGVDTAGGVETAPGKKDPERVIQFIQTARTAFESIRK